MCAESLASQTAFLSIRRRYFVWCYGSTIYRSGFFIKLFTPLLSQHFSSSPVAPARINITASHPPA